MDHKLLVNWLRLVFTPRVGPKTFLQLLEKFQSPEKVLANLSEIKKLYKLDLNPPEIGTIEDMIASTHAFGAEIIIAIDPKYPPLLKEIPYYPLVLFTKGDLSLLTRRIIALVGTRNSSLLGEKIAKKIATDLGKAGIVTVSGLARGIDSVVHSSSITSGTIGVIASGLDCFYPKENRLLQEEISAKGLIISENPLGSVPLAQNFPRRNRIISGLALGVLIVEAKKNSGTMITANYALEQGRDVFAIPGSPLDPRAEGTNWLIKNGAILTRDSQDILEELQLSHLMEVIKPEEKREELEKGETLAEMILSKINQSPVDLEELFASLDLDSSTFQQIITELELFGKIIKKGNKVSRS